MGTQDVREIVEIVTALTALYAAGLSTYNLVRQIRDRRPKVRVTLTSGFLAGPGYASEVCLFLDAANIGLVNVTLQSWAIVLPDRKKVVHPRPEWVRPLPTLLSPGEGYKLWVYRADIVKALQESGYSGQVTLRASFGDVAGNEFVSKPYRLYL